ncbi:MAG: Gfo/Idh/MocA family protein [Lautropia sp.]
MIKAAIVGTGRWGQRLVNAVATPRSDLIRFTHAVARTPANARDFCSANDLSLTADLDAVLADPSVDGVVLATPHSQHVDQVVRAAAAGKHVFVEKPLSLDARGARTAIDACMNAGVVLAVGHNRRFLPAIATMKRIVDTGELGTVLHLEGNFSGNFGLGYTGATWRATHAESPAGGMTAMGIHTIDAFIHLSGPVSAVRCTSDRKVLQVDLDDTTSMFARFENGATGYLSTMTATGRMFRLQVFGTRGWLHLLDHHLLDIGDIEGNVRRHEFPRVDTERLELEAFARAASGGGHYGIATDEVLHGIAVMQTAIESAAAGGELLAVKEPS